MRRTLLHQQEQLIHLPEQKETVHMISMLRLEACSGSIRDLAHISNHNGLADCLTKASAKADNLITADCLTKLTYIPTFERSWNRRPS